MEVKFSPKRGVVVDLQDQFSLRLRFLKTSVCSKLKLKYKDSFPILDLGQLLKG